MSTEVQIEANRQNAKKSTSPQTPIGRAHSALAIRLMALTPCPREILEKHRATKSAS
jgi:hypothetical protein